MSAGDQQLPNDHPGGPIAPNSNGHARQDVAGGGNGREGSRLLTVHHLDTIDDRILHSKALRHVCGKFEGLHNWGVEFLGCLSMYLKIRERENVGVSIKQLIDWSGARRRWNLRMREGASELEAGGFIERFKANQGTSVDITQKGRVVLREYSKKYDEVLNDSLARGERFREQNARTKRQRIKPGAVRQRVSGNNA